MSTNLGLLSIIVATATSKDCGQISTAVAASAEVLLDELFRPLLLSLPVALEIGGRNPDANEYSVLPGALLGAREMSLYHLTQQFLERHQAQHRQPR